MTEPNIQLLNIDCLEYLKQCDDKQFNLAIVDPPYGYRTKNTGTINFRQDSKEWNIAPTNKYFDELQRVSKNQIVWGGNYFSYLWKDIQRGFVIWNKDNPVKNFSDVEMAWTSFDVLPKYYYYAWGGLSDGIKGRNKKEKNIHPTQKPIRLYEFLLDEFANEGDKIIDTHLGSGSTAIACWNRKYDLIGCELDNEYYTKAVKRLEQHKKQLTIF